MQKIMDWYKSKPKKAQIVIGAIVVIVIVGVIQNFIA